MAKPRIAVTRRRFLRDAARVTAGVVAGPSRSNGNRIVSTDKILFWDHTGTKIQPCIAKDWKVSDDGRRVGQSPAAMGVRIVSRKLGNIPTRQINAQHCRTPCSSHPATFFYKA